MEEKELLDYCRVKKISEKGYGFLTSIHYDQNVFFHFNGIKDPDVKEKLEKQKRGSLYFYYTSKPHKERRRINKLWLDISEVEKGLIPEFVENITKEFIFGKSNAFEVAYVIKQLRENDFYNLNRFQQILSSERLKKNPSVLLAMLTEKELLNKDEIENLIEDFSSLTITKQKWFEMITPFLDK